MRKKTDSTGRKLGRQAAPLFARARVKESPHVAVAQSGALGARRSAHHRPAQMRSGEVDDPFYIIQGLYNDGSRASAEFGYDDEEKAISEAKKLAKISGSNWFEGDYVRVITRDGDLVWDSRAGNFTKRSRRR